MNQSRNKVNQQQIEWRHDKVLQLAANGYTGREIASQLHISQPTIHRDLVTLRQASSIKMQAYNLRMEMVLSSANLVHEAIVLAEKYMGYTIQKDSIDRRWQR